MQPLKTITLKTIKQHVKILLYNIRCRRNLLNGICPTTATMKWKYTYTWPRNERKYAKMKTTAVLRVRVIEVLHLSLPKNQCSKHSDLPYFCNNFFK